MIASSCSISGRRTDISLLILQRVAASSLFVACTILLVPSGFFKTIGVLMMVFKVEDSSNQDLGHMRNLIRHRVVPEALLVNLGLRKVVKRMILGEISKS